MKGGWVEAPLGEIARIERDAVQPSDIGDGARYVGLENITSDGTFIGTGVVASGELKSSKFRFSERHILYGKLRPYLAKIAAPTFGGLCSTDILPIRPSDAVDRGYLLHYLRSPAVVQRASNLAVGINLPRLSPKRLEQFLVPLAPLTEQRRIAAVLDSADSLRTKRREALTKLGTLTSVIFIEMFGDPDSNPNNFRRAAVGSLAEQVRGVTYNKAEASAVPGAGRIGILRAGNIGSGELVFDDIVYVPAARVTEKQMLRKGDVLVATSSGSIDVVGKAAGVTIDLPFAFGAFCKVLRPNERTTPGYFGQYFQTSAYRRRVSRLAAGANINNLRNVHLESLEIPLPPISAQNEFGARLAQIGGCSERMRVALGCSRRLFASLQHRAFRGEL